jgi:hypothetical protein
MLYQADSVKGPLLLALVCDGGNPRSSGEITAGDVAEGIKDWFEQNYLTIILRGKSIYWIKRKLKQYGEKHGINLGTSMSLLLLWQGKYFIMQGGETEIYLIQRKIKQLFFDRHSQSDCQHRPSVKNIRTGRTRRGCGFLLCNSSFRKQLSDKQLQEALRPSDLTTEKQIAKRLKSIALRSITNDLCLPKHGRMPTKQAWRARMTAIYLRYKV